MKRSIFHTAYAILAFAIMGDCNAIAQEKTEALPPAPAASADTIAKLIKSGAYQYGVTVRSISGDEDLRIGGRQIDEPRYSGVAAKGIESFGGIPMKTDGKIDTELPCSLYYKIKVVSLHNENARVKLTVGYTTDAEKGELASTWEEQIWTTHRDVRLNETDSVDFKAPKNKDVPSFQVRYRVRNFDGRID